MANKPLYRNHFLGAPTLTPYGRKVYEEYLTRLFLKLAKEQSRHDQ
jgi:hypothetical protein